MSFSRVLILSGGLAAGMAVTTPVHAAGLECHLHVPGDDPTDENALSIIPSVGTPEQCETLNQQNHAGRGRCHCSFATIKQQRFYLPQEPVNRERTLP